MNSLTIFEFDKIVEAKNGAVGLAVPPCVFSWLDMQSLRNAEDARGWLKPTQLNGQRAVQVTSYVGVIRAPCGFHIEVLPKTGRNTSPEEARALLIEMLKCLAGFRHIKTANADLVAERMPLLEVFIQQFLLAVGSLNGSGWIEEWATTSQHWTGRS
jgi:5-methylcytosine-specific restriction enzyme subunit McrC